MATNVRSSSMIAAGCRANTVMAMWREVPSWRSSSSEVSPGRRAVTTSWRPLLGTFTSMTPAVLSEKLAISSASMICCSPATSSRSAPSVAGGPASASARIDGRTQNTTNSRDGMIVRFMDGLLGSRVLGFPSPLSAAEGQIVPKKCTPKARCLFFLFVLQPVRFFAQPDGCRRQ